MLFSIVRGVGRPQRRGFPGEEEERERSFGGEGRAVGVM